MPDRKETLPRLTDRIGLGESRLQVSPICLGYAGSPATIPAAFDAGINFFFITADLHWPVYEGIRRGLEQLLARGGGIRDEIVVAVVSYLDEPLFGFLQFNEVIGAVSGLERVDLLLAGAVSGDHNLSPRVESMEKARSRGHMGSRAIGATFHSRPHALQASNDELLDILYVRYNPGHPGANKDLFPHLRSDRRAPIFSFKSTMLWTPPKLFASLDLPAHAWQPTVTDHYRFALTSPMVDGLLASLDPPEQIAALADALAQGPLDSEQELYLKKLTKAAFATSGEDLSSFGPRPGRLPLP